MIYLPHMLKKEEKTRKEPTMIQYPDYETLLNIFNECLSANYRHVENDASFAVKRVNDSVTILFEDSEGILDWRNNFRFSARPYRRMDEVWYCHRGFLSVFQAALPYFREIIEDESVKTFAVAGYSHGAALALLCHEYIWYHRPDVRKSLTGYGFGCPRVFSGRMTPSLAKRWETFYPIRNLDDLITHLPPRLFGYRHVKKLVTVGRRGKYSSIDAHRPENYRRELLFAAKSQNGRNFIYDQ